MSDMPVRRFYRVVQTDPPTVRDFMSFAALGRKLRPGGPTYLRDIFDGLSVSSTIEGAEYTARRWPNTGTFIAVLEIPDDGRLRIEQTTSTPEHYTIWGDPAEILRYVAAVFPVGTRGGP